MNLFKFFPGWFQNVSLDCSLERREIAFQLFQEAEIQQNWQIPRIQVFQAWPFPFPVLSSAVFVFRFMSLCGKERNFVRCDDRPIVFHNSKILPTPSGMVAINWQKANPKWDRHPGTFFHVLLKTNLSQHQATPGTFCTLSFLHVLLKANLLHQATPGTFCTTTLVRNWLFSSSPSWFQWCPAQVRDRFFLLPSEKFKIFVTVRPVPSTGTLKDRFFSSKVKILNLKIFKSFRPGLPPWSKRKWRHWSCCRQALNIVDRGEKVSSFQQNEIWIWSAQICLWKRWRSAPHYIHLGGEGGGAVE